MKLRICLYTEKTPRNNRTVAVDRNTCYNRCIFFFNMFRLLGIVIHKLPIRNFILSIISHLIHKKILIHLFSVYLITLHKKNSGCFYGNPNTNNAVTYQKKNLKSKSMIHSIIIIFHCRYLCYFHKR